MTLNVATYRKERARGLPARYAAAIARPRVMVLDWTTDRRGNETARTERDGFTVTLRTQPDNDGGSLGDLGYGTFTSRKEDADAIPNPNDSERDGTKWYVPMQSTAELVTYYRAQGYARGPAFDKARETQEEELRAASDSHYIVGLIATAYRADVELGGTSVWGIEAGYPAAEYLDDLAEDLIVQAIEEARGALARLCAITETER